MDKVGFFSQFGSKAKRIPLPENRFVFVRAISLEERDRFENECHDGKVRNFVNFRARFLVMAIADENGERLLGDEDLAALKRLPCADLEVVFEAAYAYSAMSKEALDELKKNSASGESVGSTSISA